MERGSGGDESKPVQMKWPQRVNGVRSGSGSSAFLQIEYLRQVDHEWTPMDTKPEAGLN